MRCARLVMDFRRGIHYFQNSSHRCGAALKNVDDPSDRYGRPGQHCQVAHECDKFSQGQLPLYDLASAKPEQGYRGHSDQRRHQRIKDSPQANQRYIALDVIEIEFAEFIDFGFFPGEGLYHSNAGHIFLRFCAQI